jgi:hypothetical protein
MKSILELPTNVISQFTAMPEEFWSQVSNYLYGQLLESTHDQLLTRIAQRFDFAALVKGCQAYRLYAGQRGQAADYSVEQLCRALVLRHLNHWSFRTTCAEIKSNLLLRWFVGFLVNEQTLSYVTLQRFEEWMLRHQPRLLFAEMLRQIDQDFPEDATQPQVGDTFALLARSAPQSRTQLLRNAGRKVIFYLQPVAPSVCADLLLSPLPAALFGPPDAPQEYWLNKEARDELELHTAQAADDLCQQVQAHLAQGRELRTLEAAALRRWLAILRKLLTDEFVIARAANGVVSTVRHCTKEERGSFVLGSTVDTEATFRNHGKKNDLGYNVQVAATAKFIREIFAATGATSDATGIAALVANQLVQTGHAPPKLIYDRAAGSPKLFHDVDKASNGQTQLVARLIDHSKNSACFGPTHFTLNEDGSLTCPNGQVSSTCYRAQTADGYHYRFTAQQCQACPLWQYCRGEELPAPPEPGGGEPVTAAPASTAPASTAPVSTTPASTAPVSTAPAGTAPVSTAPASTAPVKTTRTRRRKQAAATVAPVDAAAADSAAAKTKQPKAKKPKVKKPKVAHRTVFISDYRDWQRRAILYTTTPAFKLDMAFRSTIERIIACLVRYNGARHATAYGLLKADFQARMAATAFNLKRWAVLMHEKEHPRRAKLAPDTS